MNAVVPFRVAVPDAVLDDLAARLARTRIPEPPVLTGGEDADTVRRIEELLAYWRDGYDWRAQERRLNAVPHHRATVDGVGLHFIEVPGNGPDPLPLLLANGWPSSFVEYLGVLSRLADPGAHGGDPADAFTVVAPALPGYGFSDRGPDATIDRAWIAGLFDRLMTRHLGHGRYVAHGDDIGGGVVGRLGMFHADTVLAIQTTNPLRPSAGDGPGDDDERAYTTALRAWERDRGAYAHVQATRAQTLAYGLNDSPAGLAAWILEKFLTWSDPAARDRLSADDLLTTVTLYWATQTIGTSARLYAPGAARDSGEAVATPASVLVTREPGVPVQTERLLRRRHPRLTGVHTVERGGHFLALEAPEEFTAAVRRAFRPYRAAAFRRPRRT